MAINCSNICSFIGTIILVHWFIGVGTFTSAFIQIFSKSISLLWELGMFLLAYLIIFMTSFTHFMYWAWTLLAFAINVIYIGIVFFTLNHVQQQDKTIARFFQMFAICVVIPQLFDWIFLFETLRVYVVLPVNLTLFLTQLDLSTPQQKIRKMIVNLVLFSFGITLFY